MAESKQCISNIFLQNNKRSTLPENTIATESPNETFAKISTLLFDLDNTLIPTRVGDAKACRKLVDVLENQFGFTKEESTTATASFLKSFRRCPDNTLSSLDSWRIYLWHEALANRHKHLANDIYGKWFQLRYRHLALSPDIVRMLQRFRETGYVLGLITNGPSNAQWEKIKILHISQYFDCVLISSDLPWEKPDPNIFYAACNSLNVKPAECAMIGDKLTTDVKGGRLANLGATFWLPLNPNEADLSGVEFPPDVILRNILDLAELFPALSTPCSVGSSTLNSLISTKHLPNRGRYSQINCSGSISTCGGESYPQQKLPYDKNRCGGSLPDIEYLSSETESSLDSTSS